MDESAATTTETKEITLSPRELELEDLVKQDPFNTEAWEELAGIVIQEKVPQKVRSVLERLLQLFPLSSSYWVRYAELEEEFGQTENVQNILRRSLKSSYSVDIWEFYLSWLSRTKMKDQNLNPTELAEARSVISQAFEEAVDPLNIGWSMEAYTIWKMYINFLKEMPEEDIYHKTQKLDAIRKAYSEALGIPIRGLETLWKEYQAYEISNSEQIAKQQLDKIERNIYKNASENLKEREDYWRPLLANSTSPQRNLSLPTQPSSYNNFNNIDLWNKMLSYEKGNPQNLDPVKFKIRVRLAYRHALKTLWFHPDIWYSFFDFERSTNDVEAGFILLRQSLSALPDSTILHFCLADALELDGNNAEAREVLERLLERQPSNFAYIQRMRFARRVDGIAVARDVFRQARSWNLSDSSIYCAAAEIEFKQNKAPTVARKVFDLGLRRFPKDSLLAHRYLDLMLCLNDYEATKEVFERLIKSFETSKASVEESFPLWERYREFERDNSRDISLIADLEHRMQQNFSSRPELFGVSGILHRYCLYGKLPSLDNLNIEPETLLNSSSSNTRIIRIETQVSTTKLTQKQQQQQQQQAFTASSPEPSDDAELPTFLRKLVSILPRKLHLDSVDVDFVVRNLSKSSLPPAPISSRIGGMDLDEEDASGSTLSKKRTSYQLGVGAKPEDAFKERQKRSRNAS